MNHHQIKVLFSILFLTLILSAKIYSVYESDTVVITGNRIPEQASEISRNIQIINQKKIQKQSVSNIKELLGENTTIDLKSRGPKGVQSDISIRGANYNQSIVMIDGVKINDPQTGHHNLNLPVTMFDIGRVEILKGGGSRVYGPNAFGGAINILTKESSDYNTNIRVAYGENKYFDRTISTVIPIGNLTNRISYSKQTSNGYRKNTDFDITTLFYKSSLNTNLGQISLTGGYLDKEFGANEFYTPGRFPNQWEATKTKFVSLQHDYNPTWGRINTKVAWRNHKDRFLLKKTDPEFYENNHKTDLYTVKTDLTLNSDFMRTNLGLELGREKIVSSTLGDHHRDRIGLYFEGKKQIGKLSITPGISAFYYSNWNWQMFPGLNLGYQISERVRVTGSIGKSFRVPTYTNLYYQGPVNKGNSELKPEEAWSHELGIKYSGQKINSAIIGFIRNNDNLIDWQKVTDTTWRAKNINKITMNGIEANVSLNKKLLQRSILDKLKFAYTYLNGNRNTDYKSKYVFNYLQHKAVLNIGHDIFDGINSVWSIQYEDRRNGEDYFLVDFNTYMKYREMKIYIEISNLMDTHYKGHGYITMPGRWITGGVEFSL